MLEVDARQLRQGPVETVGRMDPADPSFVGLDLALESAVEVTGRLAETGDQEYFWRGHLTGSLKGSCRRCLADVVYPLNASVEALFSADPDVADDPAVYPLQAPVTHVDLRPVVREEVALAVSAFPLCREECRGLCPRCGSDLNAGPCSCTAPSD